MWSQIGPAFADTTQPALRDVYNRGVIALGNSDFGTAILSFRQAARSNHVSAIFNLASIHLLGRTPELELDTGFALMERAAALGHGEAATRATLNRRYANGFLPDESVVRMMMLAGPRLTDGLLIRALAKGMVHAIEAGEAAAFSAWHFHEMAQFLREGGAARGYIRRSECGPDRATPGMREALQDYAGSQGAEFSGINDHLFRILAGAFDMPKSRLTFIRCSAHALVFSELAPGVPLSEIPGLAFYESAEWQGLAGVDPRSA